MSERKRFAGPGAGTAMAMVSMSCVQLGLAVSVGLIGELGAGGVAWLRLAWAAVLFVLIARPWRIRFTRSLLITCALLGVATAGMTTLFMYAVTTLPLGTAVALEFLGPLGVAVARGRGLARLWGGVAAIGVLALTEPWHGRADLVGVLCALGAAACWAVYILLTQRAGDSAEGLGALAISMPVAAIVTTIVFGPATFGRLEPGILLFGLGLAVLLPLIPFSLELLALRRLSSSAFGTLMCLEPALGLVIGLVLLGQVPTPVALGGIALVVIAGIGATRTGRRRDEPVPDEPAPEPADDATQRKGSSIPS